MHKDSDNRSAAPWGHFELFGVSHEAIRQTMADALSRGGDDCDLFFEHTISTSVSLSDSIVNRGSSSVDLGMGVRVRSGDQIGYAYTELLDLDAMRQAARAAAEIASSGTARTIPNLSPRPARDLYPLTRAWSDVGVDERVLLLQELEKLAFSRDPRVYKVQAWTADSEKHILIARPDGRLVEDFQPMTLAVMTCVAQQGKRRESSSANLSARRGMDLYDPSTRSRLAETAADRALRLLDSERPPAGEMPIVLAAGASGILLHEAIGHGMEADFNRKRVSIYADRLGKRVANPEVTIIDDGTLPHARGSINTDDEANPPERTVLVRSGILESYLHDEISADHYHVRSTGSGRREGFRSPVLPRMRTTFMQAGPHDPAEILASVKKGIYCEIFSNGQVQIGAGDFSFYMKHGWLIEDGRLTVPLKEANIIGNGPESLERVSMVGNDLVLDDGGWTCGKDGQGVPVGHGMPTVLVSSLVVGGVG